jgi:hypothetical protein
MRLKARGEVRKEGLNGCLNDFPVSYTAMKAIRLILLMLPFDASLDDAVEGVYAEG